RPDRATGARGRTDRRRVGRLRGRREERVADRATPSDPGRDGEDRASLVPDELVQGVASREVALDGDELPCRIALEAGEEESGVELPHPRVDPVREREASA